MAFKYREKFLVEKCINTLTHNYLDNKGEYHSALQDYKIEFIAFLTSNDKEYVDYGIDYLCKEYPQEAELLQQLIMEYRTNGTQGSLSWDPIPQSTQTITQPMTNPIYQERNIYPEKCSQQCEEPIEEGPECVGQYKIDIDDCTIKEKIVLFVMKVLGMYSGRV